MSEGEVFGVRENIFYWEREVKNEYDLCSDYIRKLQLVDQSIYRDLSSTKSWQKWIYRGAVEDLSMAKISRWIENLSKIYRPDRELRKLARWIEEVVEILSRRNPKISMDRECDKIYREKKKEGLDRRKSVEDLSRSCRAWRKGVFPGGKTQRDECNKQSTQPKIQSIC